MELDMLEVLLCHREDISGVGKEHIPTLLVLSHILVLALLEGLEFLLVITTDPASLVQMHRFPAALCIVFILQTVLNDLKLQLSYGANDFTVIKLVLQPIRRTPTT